VALVSPSCGALSSVRANGPVSMSVSYQRIDCRGICPRRRVAMLPPETVCICIPMAKRMRTLILFDWNVDTPPDHVARRVMLGGLFYLACLMRTSWLNEGWDSVEGQITITCRSGKRIRTSCIACQHGRSVSAFPRPGTKPPGHQS
jgi:hypothetical protein